MSALPGTPLRPHPVRRTAMVAALIAAASALAGCNAGVDSTRPAAAAASSSASSPSATPTESAATVASSVPADVATVPVDQKVELTAQDGTLKSVKVVYGEEHDKLAGKMSADQTTWTATDRLEPGLLYTVRTVAVDDNGLKARDKSSFRTEDLSLAQQTYPNVAPLAGETVGVGMPVIIKFDVAVTDHAAIEKHLAVSSTPKQVGAWHWLSDHEVHWRPKSYWKPGTDVTLDADINSIPAGNGIYGQLSRTVQFHIGDSMISKIDVARHEMKVYRNGTLLRTVPISAGKPGFTTRSGTKVIIEKFRHKRMDAATTGISKDDPEYYNIADVEYAMRVTYSGEFLHAAPWSVGSQGSANVSHGCVGMSTADAAWLFNLSKRGDVVEVTGSDRHMTLTNGYGDWNESFAEWKKGSALS
jgi:lipoprotein-anchoring transpeptidase ErfK/SrfK